MTDAAPLAAARPVEAAGGADARGGPAPRLTWGLCVATKDRIDILALCVGCALEQTRPPKEIVIVDASRDWEANRDRLDAVARAAGVPLRHCPAPKPSSAAQRNHAVRVASADVVFLIDDDSLMFPTCAEAVMAVYEADRDGIVAAVSATGVDASPLEAAADARPPAGAARKDGMAAKARLRRLADNSALVRWLTREVLMLSRDRMFVPYDGLRPHADPARLAELDLAGMDVVPTRFIPGFAMTARRTVALAEPFDGHLLAYCPTEDLDASYRFARHGLNVLAREARLHHYTAATGRIRRRQAALLGITNSAYFTRRSADRPARQIPHFFAMAVRRAVGEIFKDLGTGRFGLPQARGAFEGLLRSVAVIARPRAGLGDWYEGYQARILETVR